MSIGELQWVADRYDRLHPTVSVTVPKALYTELMNLRRPTGKGLGDILREAVEKQLP